MAVKKSIPIVTIHLNSERRLMSDEKLDTSEKVVKMIQREMADYAREVVYALYLNSSCQPVAIGRISEGTTNQSLVSPVQIFQTALLCNSVHMILFHNHPSGSLVPSDEDIRLTKRVIAGAEIMGMQVLDHIIIGGNQYMSMMENRTVDFNPHESIDTLIRDVKGR